MTNAIAEILAFITTFAELMLLLTTLWRIKALEKKVAALEKEFEE